jgi:hypothetical protein
VDIRGEHVLQAIDVLTAWTTESDSTDFAMSRAEQYVGEPDGERKLRNGLITLVGLLLVQVTKEAGSDTATPEQMRAVLQEIAKRLTQ